MIEGDRGWTSQEAVPGSSAIEGAAVVTQEVMLNMYIIHSPTCGKRGPVGGNT